jgi:catechol 2,3-dioxygenase-like lactoylglutathione lyase family enzyme
MRLNHLMLTVRNLTQSRDWYVSKLGLKVEFELPAMTRPALTCLRVASSVNSNPRGVRLANGEAVLYRQP